MKLKLSTLSFLIILFSPFWSVAQKLDSKSQQPHKNLKHIHESRFTVDHHDADDPFSQINKYRSTGKFRNGSSLTKVQLNDPICKLLAADYTSNSFVSPPQNFLAGQSSISRVNTDCSTVLVNYNFPSEISTDKRAAFINAFEYAAAIWESQLSSNVPIRINANFGPLGEGVLGSAGPRFIWRFAVGEPFYGEALLDQILGIDLSGPGIEDIGANFNTDFGWYLGTDGQAPPGTFDFVTVVLHELGHGLGFFGSGNAIADPVLGIYGLDSSPFIYDTFLEDGGGNALSDIAPPDVVSPALGGLFQGNDLVVNSPSLDGPKRLYTPFPFNRGSSYSHWDENSFPRGTPNSLMTPFLGFQEANHDPGENTLAMFQDHGWQLSQDCDAPESQDLSERCNISGISPDPLFPPFLCDNPGVFSAEGGVFGPVGSHVMCFKIDGIDPFNQPLDFDQYQVIISGKSYDILFFGYDFFQGEQYFYLCVGGVASTGKKNVPVKIKLASGCTFTQGQFYDSPDCELSQEMEIATRSVEDFNSQVVNISPNPSNGFITLETEFVGLGKMRILNSIGQLIYSSNSITAGNVNIDLSNNNAGIYFLEVLTENARSTKKFVIK